MPGGTWITAKRDLIANKYARFANFINYVFMTNGEEIYSSKDSITWGDDNLINKVPINSISYSNPTVTLNLGEGHGINQGDSIIIAGVQKALPILDVSYAANDVTVTVAAGHDVKVGDSITMPVMKKTIQITGVAYNNPNVTLTVPAGHGVLAGNVITVSSLDFNYNGIYTVTSTTATTIVYQQAGLPAPVDVTGTLTIVESDKAVNVANVVYADPNITFMVPSGHGILTGTEITVSGLDDSYNGTYTVTSTTATSVVVQKPLLAAPVKTTGKLIGKLYSGPATVKSFTATTIVFTKAGLPSPMLKEGTLKAIDIDYNGIHTITAAFPDKVQYTKDGIVATAPLSMGYFTVDFTLAGKDIFEYSNLLYIVGLKNFESDFIWCEIPTKNELNEYEISWVKTNSLTVATGDGEDLVGGIVCGSSAFLFKPSSMFRIIAPVEDNGYQEISKTIGASDRRNIAVVDSSIAFYNEGRKNSKRGFYTFNPLTDSEPKIISEIIQPYIDGMDLSTEVVAEVRNDLYVAYIGPIVNEAHGIDMEHAYWVYNAKDQKSMGVWDLGVPSTCMSQLMVNGRSEFCIGDDNGRVWLLDYGYEDAVEFEDAGGNPIELEVISQIYDISADQEGTRSNYIMRSVKNVWIFGDNLQGVEFFYRFNPKSSDKGGWIRKRGLRGPVAQIPIKIKDVYTWQYGFREIGRKPNSPVIRKIRIEYE